MTMQWLCRKAPFFARSYEVRRGVSVSIDTETSQRKSEAPHVEQQQELADFLWRSSRRLRQVPRAIQAPAIPASLEF